MNSAFSSKEARHEVGRALSRLLRELLPSARTQYDQFGFAEISAIVKAMCDLGHNISEEQLREVVAKDPQRRFQIAGKRIRAVAGHRFAVESLDRPVEPPEFLFHGTAGESLSGITEKGILKMGKAFVHLTDTLERARRIGLRKNAKPVLLRIRSLDAFRAGIRFWESGQVSSDGKIFLADEIPFRFVDVLPDSLSLQPVKVRTPRHSHRAKHSS